MNTLGTIVLAGLTATLISMVATKPSKDDYIRHATNVIPPKACINVLTVNPFMSRQSARQACENGGDIIDLLLRFYSSRLPGMINGGFQNLVSNTSDCEDYLVLQICSTDLLVYEHKSLAVFGRLIDLDS
ncbi:MAG: hypothetical protein WBA43_19985 [Elainellaceae cyanobacterium]|jgi:hypothetical protein